MAGERHVGHRVLAAFAEDRVNVPVEEAKERRRQVNHLRERLEAYIADHPDYNLVKLRASGSTAKHTAIRRRRGEGSDADVAAYVHVADTDVNEAGLLEWLRDRSRSTERRRSLRTSLSPSTLWGLPCGAPA